ncbi:MAG: hypothetical protein HY287_03620 [Planctomycetes bacterium]|nr:hypothetical protein [Planctomycetota bacterium]MBI3833400.1 hypothetical protein [Planctomycetota bacterium]
MNPDVEIWAPAKPCGRIKLHADGSYSIGSESFDQSREFERKSFRDMVVDKLAGEGQPLVLRATEATYTYKYENAQWLMKDHAAQSQVATTPHSSSRSGLLIWLLAGISALAFLGLVGYVLLMRSRDVPPELAISVPQQSPPTDPALEEQARHAAEEEKRRELAESERRLKEQTTLARADLQAVADEGAKVLRLLADFQDEFNAWNGVETLLSDDRGKFLAADETYLRSFRAIYEKPRPSKQDAEAIRRNVESLLEPINTALVKDQTPFSPNPGVRRKLGEEATSAAALVTAYREPRLQIETTLRQAQAVGRSANMTLREALDQLAEREAEEQTGKIAQAEDAARKEKIARIAAEKGEAIRQQGENEVGQIRADEEAQKKQAEAKATKTVGDAEAARRIALAQSTEIRRVLAPFTTSGVWQPGQRTPNLEKTPVSLNALRAFGALQLNDSGLKKLWYCGNAKARFGTMRVSEDTMRPRWGYGPVFEKLSPAELRELRQAQQYLIDLGDVLVELKMLAP